MPKKNDIFAVLMEEHEKITAILNELMSGVDTMSAAQIRKKVETLKQDLVLHMDMEEKAVYPELKRLEDLKDEMEDAVKEHQELRTSLKALNADTPDEELLQRLLRMVSHHVSNEEEEIFTLARRVMPTTDYEEMSREAMTVREELKSEANRS